MRRAESWPVVLAACLLVVGAGIAVAAPAPDRAPADGGIDFDPPVPREYEFERGGRADGVATVDGERFDDLGAALDAADPGDTVRLRGVFEATPNVTTRGITIVSAPGHLAVIEGAGEGDVVTIEAPNVTVRRVWVRNAGYAASENDAAVWIDAPNVTVADSRVTEMTFGIWINGHRNVRVVNNTIVGRERITPLSKRGNGIQVWEVTDATIARNRITDVRDGIYFSWASNVVARNNTMWDLRYGVHYMYSDRCRLVDNTAFGNDVGYALMVSQHLRIVDNVAVNNTGRSGHGIMVKSIDDSVLRGNDLVANDRGIFLYNSLNNTVAGNLLLANDVGVHLTAGSTHERVYNNSFVRNDDQVKAVINAQVAWNGSGRGNYWSTASPVDTDDDGIGETRYQPDGLVERLTRRHPKARIFAASPAFDVVRLAESTVPVIESPGVVDYHPLERSPHDWRRYYASDRDA